MSTFFPPGNTGPTRSPAVPSTSSSWTETALSWQQRSNRKKRERETPNDPASAAWSFVRASSSLGGGATGVGFVDVALRHPYGPHHSEQDSRHRWHRLPVIDVRGDAGCGKTWTVITLAARFVTSTVPSMFKATTERHDCEHPTPPAQPPRVIVLDSHYDVTPTKLAYAVRSALLLKMDHRLDEDRLHDDTESCCRRVHIVTASRTTDWVAVLEIIRNQLVSNPTSPSSDHQVSPTLVLWDGFLDEPTTEAQRAEVIRQLVRVLQDCPVMFVSTALPTARRYEWERHVTHRIRLQRDHNTHHHSAVASNISPERFAATVRGNRIPYSISLAGILS